MKIIIFLFLIVFTYQEYLDDFKKCTSADKSQCKSISLPNSNMECCFVSAVYENPIIQNTNICSAFLTIKMTQEMKNQIQAYNRESMGFTMITVMGIDNYDFNLLSRKLVHDCPSQKFTIDYSTGTYTNEEKEILKKENYCLRLYYEGLFDLGLLPSGNLKLKYKEITKEDCSNAVLLPSSENIATCAYGSFDFKLADGSTKHLNTCLYTFNSAFDSKTLDQNSQDSFSSYLSINGTAITSYTVEINDKNGKSITYDSKTESLVSTTNNKGELLGWSKLFALILMVCLL